MSILSSHSSTLLSQLSAQAPSTTATNEAQLPSQQLSDYDIPSTTTKKFNTNNNEGIISATNKQGRILSNVINSETTPYDMTYRTNDNNNGIINNNSSPRTTSRGQQKITLTRYLSDIVHDNPEVCTLFKSCICSI